MVKKGRNLSKVVWPSSSSGPLPRQATKIGRNELCPCGSGKKYKDCHRDDGDAFLRKLAHAEHKRERKERLDREGVPWWKRPFVR